MPRWSLGRVSPPDKGERSGLWTRIAIKKRFIVRGDEMLTAFLELQTAVRERQPVIAAQTTC